MERGYRVTTNGRVWRVEEWVAKPISYVEGALGSGCHWATLFTSFNEQEAWAEYDRRVAQEKLFSGPWVEAKRPEGGA